MLKLSNAVRPPLESEIFKQQKFAIWLNIKLNLYKKKKKK